MRRAAVAVLMVLVCTCPAWSDDDEAGKADAQATIASLRALDDALTKRVAAIEAAAEDARKSYLEEKRRRGTREEGERLVREARLAALGHERRRAESLLQDVRETQDVEARLGELRQALDRLADRRGDAAPETLSEALAGLRRGYADVEATLVAAKRRGTDMFALTGQSRTTLHLAAEDEDAERARRALAAGVDPDQPDADGFTALHFAAWWGADGVARELQDAASSVDVRARTTPKEGDPLGCSTCPMAGATALHMACYAGHPAVVTTLLDAGADPKLRVKWRDCGTG